MKLSIVLAGIFALVVSATPVTNPTCITTLRTLGHFDLSPTTTIYAETATAISQVNCGGCSLEIQNIGGVGPVRPVPTATVSEQITTTTEIACLPTV